jgi:hypothetical protein
MGYVLNMSVTACRRIVIVTGKSNDATYVIIGGMPARVLVRE